MAGKHFTIRDALYVGIFLILLYLMITAWDEFLDFLFIRFCGLDRETVLFHAAASILFTTIVILILFLVDEDVRYLFGIDG